MREWVDGFRRDGRLIKMKREERGKITRKRYKAERN